jgi:uncharacterized protein with HEPN domain
MKNQLVYLEDALDSLRLVLKYVDGIRCEEFLQLPEKQDSVIYRVAMIGEALVGTDSGFRKTHPEIPWNDVIGIRNVLVHDYGSIDLQRVWDTIEVDLKGLQTQLQAILDNES